MRLCVPIPCFYPELPAADAIHRAAALGFDAVETYDWKGLDIPAVRAACEECGVELVSMCPTEFRMTDPAYRTAWLDGLRESCAAARSLGVRRLITQVGQDTGAPREEQHAAIVTTLREAIPILEEAGVTAMIEPLNTIVDHPGYYLTTAAEGFSIVREVGHPLVKLVYDIYHQQIMEGNIIPNVTANLDCIAHLHSAGHPGRHELQYGESDYRVIFEAIDRAGYAACCGLEYFPLLPPDESLQKARQLYLGEE